MSRPDTAAPPPVDEALRRCSRCRLLFPIAPGTTPAELGGWWTCPDCHHALTPDQGPKQRVDS